MKISDKGIELIKKFEGCKLEAYKPVATEEYYTIGWGHYGKDVTKGLKITQSQADDMLKTDLPKYEGFVNNSAYVPLINYLNQNQYDSLVSFCYNLGPNNLKTLCENRNIDQIADAILLYNKAGGKILQGLINRRLAERTLYKSLISEGVTIDYKAKYESLLKDVKNLVSKYGG